MKRILGGLLKGIFFLGIAYFILAIAAIVVRTVVWVFDKILQTNYHQYADNAYDTFSSEVERYKREYINQPLWEWADRVGLIGTMDSALEVLTRGIVLTTVFLLLGCWFYFLRVVHRIKYAFIELTVAFVAMLYAVNGMAGGVFTATHTVAFLSGLYVMVRGLQNIDDGIKILMEAETAKGVDGAAHSAHELWRAVFYLPYSKSHWPERKDSLAKVLLMILEAYLPEKTDDNVVKKVATEAVDQENSRPPVAEETEEPASTATSQKR